MPSRSLLCLCAAPFLILACDMDVGETRPALEAAGYSLPKGRVEHAVVLVEVDHRIDFFMDRADSDLDSWMALESVAGELSTRSRLTGRLEELLEADTALDEAFARAAVGSGPWLSRALLDFSLHHFDLVASSLDVLEERAFLDDSLWSAMLGLRGDVEVQRGQLESAETMLIEAEELDPTSSSAARLAHLAWRRGDYSQAEDWYATGLSRYHGADPTLRAWFHLQLGIMDLDREAFGDALEHFLEANDEVSGYYLIEEHIAEVWTRQGSNAQALGLYLDIIERTDNPEFMDAVAGIYTHVGMTAEAGGWIKRASERHEQQVELAPQAAFGHSLDHFVAFGPSARAVELAESNFQIRPNGDARSALIAAYLADGRLEDAVEQADAIAGGTWRTVPALSAAVSAYEAAGRGSGATAVELRSEICANASALCE